MIVAETVEMEAHRVVLAACSPYFCAMFTGTACDTRQCGLSRPLGCVCQGLQHRLQRVSLREKGADGSAVCCT